ncbi:MAG: hypothetical protein AB7I34_09195 [Rhizobiaceae bacterium]
MNLTPLKRLDIFVEGHALEPLERVLGEAGFKGWSVLTAVEGAGAHGAWHQTGVGEAEARLVIAIGTEPASSSVLAWLADYFRNYPGIVSVTDVSVMRGDRF